MKVIAHRGNTDGPSIFENQPQQLLKAISLGFDVEVDVWYMSGHFWSGHNSAQYLLTKDFINQIKDRAWFHCKNIDALLRLSLDHPDCEYFWHQEDDTTLTKNGYFWTYPGRQLTTKSVSVMPETINRDSSKWELDCYGVCTDYPKEVNL